MKRLLLLLWLLPLFAFQTDTSAKLIGKWVGEDQTKAMGYILFDNEGYVTIGIGNETYGGKEFTMNGQKGQMTYEVNADVDPIEIDFIVKKFDDEQEDRLTCLAKFINDDQMLFIMGYEADETANFDEDSEQTILLTREK